MTNAPRRIRLSRAKGWEMPAGAVKVDRSTPWGNPFVVGRDGDAAECVRLHQMLLSGYGCISGKAPLDEQLRHERHVQARIHELAGKSLACWCGIGKPCHADTLMEAAANVAARKGKA